MSVGKVLQWTPADVDERKLTLRDPESGRGREGVRIERVSKIILRPLGDQALAAVMHGICKNEALSA